MSKQRLVLSRAAVFLLAASTFCGNALAQFGGVPLITGTLPTAVAPGGPDLTLTINGANVSTSSLVSFNDIVLTPTAGGVNSIVVTVPAAKIATAGTAKIIVVNSVPQATAATRGASLAGLLGGIPSNTAYLSIATPTQSASQTITGVVSTPSPISSVTGDFNNDGFIDVAVGDADGSIKVFLGDGAGHFSPAGAVGTTVGTAVAVIGKPVALATGDFNNDGFLDLVVGTTFDASPSNVTVQAGDGAGHFTAVGSGVSIPEAVTGLVAADLNSDNALDAGVITNGQIFYNLQGDGAGGFVGRNTQPFTTTALLGHGSTGGAVGDFNRDGIPDAAAADTTDNTVSVLLTTLDGPAYFNRSAVGVGPAPTSVVVGDFNNDGNLDIVSSNSGDGSFSFLAGNGDGTFGPQTFAAKAKALIGTAPAAGLASVIASGDFNADGFLDIVIYDGATITIYLGNGQGGFSEATTSSVQGLAAIGVGDLNGDGYPDVIVSTTAQAGGPQLTVPATLDFGNINLGSAATKKPLVLTNSGTVDVNVSSVAITGPNAADFAASNTCAVVTAGNTCTLTVSFTPTVAGAESATLTITSDAGVRTVALSGTGVGIPVAAAPAAVSFGGSNLGVAVSKTVTLSNTGTGVLTVSNVAVTGPFAITGGTCTTLAAGGSCALTVAFTPTAVGPATGTLTFTDDSNGTAGSTQSTALGGTGLGAIAAVTPAALTFGNQNTGTTSAPQTVTVKNNGNAPLTVSAVGTAAPFAAVSGCAAPVAPGASCTITVTFAPTAAGAASGTLTVTDNSTTGPMQTVALSGTGVATTGPKAAITPSSLAFGNQLVGTTSGNQTVMLKNTGTATLNIASIVAAPGDFLIAGRTCGATLAVNATCNVLVVFRPAGSGARTGTLTFTDNSTTGPTQVVSLSGTGTFPRAAVSPTSLTFTDQSLFTTSPAQVVTLTNSGTGPLTVNGINIGGSSFFAVSSSTCPRTLAASATCLVRVTFSPTRAGASTGVLNILTDGGNPKVTLAGVGVLRRLVANPGSLFFNGRNNVVTPAQAVTITNNGSTLVNISGITLGGANAANFAIASSTCGSSLAVGANCRVNVTFRGPRTGFFNAALNVASNAPAVSVTLQATSR